MLAAHLDSYVDNDADTLVFTGPSGRPLRRSNFNKLLDWRRVVTEWACRNCTCMIFGILATPSPPAHPAPRPAT